MIHVNSPTQPVTFFILSQGKPVRLRRRSSYVVAKGFGFVSYVNLFQDKTSVTPNPFEGGHNSPTCGGKPCLLARLGVKSLDFRVR